jgi:hypothetical protein
MFSDISSDSDIVSSKRQKLNVADDVNDPNLPSTPELYKRLQEVDPERASEIHPNERRKMLRSLNGKTNSVGQILTYLIYLLCCFVSFRAIISFNNDHPRPRRLLSKFQFLLI